MGLKLFVCPEYSPIVILGENEWQQTNNPAERDEMEIPRPDLYIGA